VFLSNFVPNTYCFWDIRLQICRDLENRVRGPSKSLEMSPFDRVHMTSYWRSIVTISLSHVVSEIFNVEKYCDLEIGVRGHSRSLKVGPFGRSYVFLLLFFSNSVPKTHRFWDIRLVSIQWPWHLVKICFHPHRTPATSVLPLPLINIAYLGTDHQHTPNTNLCSTSTSNKHCLLRHRSPTYS